jgi:hypothetical protein
MFREKNKQPVRKPPKPQLTIEIQSLYFQCLNDEHIEMDRQKKQLVAYLCMALFPRLRKQAKQGMITKQRRYGNLLYYAIGGTLILLFIILVVGKYSG